MAIAIPVITSAVTRGILQQVDARSAGSFDPSMYPEGYAEQFVKDYGHLFLSEALRLKYFADGMTDRAVENVIVAYAYEKKYHPKDALYDIADAALFFHRIDSNTHERRTSQSIILV